MKKVKIGIFGTGRGLDLARNFMMLNCDVAAICELRSERVADARRLLGEDAAVYDDFERFLDHGLDAVVLANNFPEHAPYAVKCLERGIHVYSECLSNATMAEGVALIRAAEQSKAIYMIGENCVHTVFTREMKRVRESGVLGKILYAEGEYNHPFNPLDAKSVRSIRPEARHWRNFLPQTYYLTHSLGPVMAITGATPKRVTALAAFAPFAEDVPTGVYCADQTAVITTQNDDGSLFRVTGCTQLGGGYDLTNRICGTRGQMQNLYGVENQIMLRYNKWSVPEGGHTVELYKPEWHDADEKFIKLSGHGGADYLTCREFLECVAEGKQPRLPLDVHSAVTMSSVAILAHRSVLEGGKPYDIPDFHLEECRKAYENDRLSPFYGSDGSEPTIPCCSHPDYQPTDKQIGMYLEQLREK